MAKQKVDYHSHSSFNYALFITELLANVTEKEMKALSTLHPNDLKEYTSAAVSFVINAIPLNIDTEYYDTVLQYDMKASEIHTRYSQTSEYNTEEIRHIISEITKIRKSIMEQTKRYWNRLQVLKSADEVLEDIATR